MKKRVIRMQTLAEVATSTSLLVIFSMLGTEALILRELTFGFAFIVMGIFSWIVWLNIAFKWKLFKFLNVEMRQ